MKNKAVHILLFFGFFHLGTLSAQSDFKNPEEYAKQADKFFEKENFREAYTFYQTLRSNYPDNAEYNFRLGVCMMFSEPGEKTRPIFYFEKAIEQGIKDDRLYFYLGKVYHDNYRFSEAQASYTKYKDLARDKSVAKFDIDRRIEECENGISLLSYAKLFYVVDKQLVKNTTFYKSYDLSSSGARIIAVPEELKTKLDQKRLSPPFGLYVAKANMLYFASYGAKGQHGLDIYRSQKKHGEWSNPENLGRDINTDYDDAYPFISKDGRTLYFSSKGHNSMGGYDVFRARFSLNSFSWADCENLNFPINTPFDDLFFAPDTNATLAFFSSDRQSLEGKIYVYHIGLNTQSDEQDLAKAFRDGEDASELAELLKDIAELKTNVKVEDYQKKIPQQAKNNDKLIVDSDTKTSIYKPEEDFENVDFEKKIDETYITYKKMQASTQRLALQKKAVRKVASDYERLAEELSATEDQKYIEESIKYRKAALVSRDVENALGIQIVKTKKSTNQLLEEVGYLQRYVGMQQKDSAQAVYRRILAITAKVDADQNIAEQIIGHQQALLQDQRNLASEKYKESLSATEEIAELKTEIRGYEQAMKSTSDPDEFTEYREMIAVVKEEVENKTLEQKKLYENYERKKEDADKIAVELSEVNKLLNKYIAYAAEETENMAFEYASADQQVDYSSTTYSTVKADKTKTKTTTTQALFSEKKTNTIASTEKPELIAEQQIEKVRTEELNPVQTAETALQSEEEIETDQETLIAQQECVEIIDSVKIVSEAELIAEQQIKEVGAEELNPVQTAESALQSEEEIETDQEALIARQESVEIIDSVKIVSEAELIAEQQIKEVWAEELNPVQAAETALQSEEEIETDQEALIAQQDVEEMSVEELSPVQSEEKEASPSEIDLRSYHQSIVQNSIKIKEQQVVIDSLIELNESKILKLKNKYSNKYQFTELKSDKADQLIKEFNDRSTVSEEEIQQLKELLQESQEHQMQALAAFEISEMLIASNQENSLMQAALAELENQNNQWGTQPNMDSLAVYIAFVNTSLEANSVDPQNLETDILDKEREKRADLEEIQFRLSVLEQEIAGLEEESSVKTDLEQKLIVLQKDLKRTSIELNKQQSMVMVLSDIEKSAEIVKTVYSKDIEQALTSSSNSTTSFDTALVFEEIALLEEKIKTQEIEDAISSNQLTNTLQEQLEVQQYLDVSEAMSVDDTEEDIKSYVESEEIIALHLVDSVVFDDPQSIGLQTGGHISSLEFKSVQPLLQSVSLEIQKENLSTPADEVPMVTSTDIQEYKEDSVSQINRVETNEAVITEIQNSQNNDIVNLNPDSVFNKQEFDGANTDFSEEKEKNYYAINPVDLVHFTVDDVTKVQQMLLIHQKQLVNQRLDVSRKQLAAVENTNGEPLFTADIKELEFLADSINLRITALGQEFTIKQDTVLDSGTLKANIVLQKAEYKKLSGHLADTAQYFEDEEKKRLLLLADQLETKADSMSLIWLGVAEIEAQNKYHENKLVLVKLDFESPLSLLTDDARLQLEKAEQEFELANKSRESAINTTLSKEERSSLLAQASVHQQTAFNLQNKVIDLYKTELQQSEQYSVETKENTQAEGTEKPTVSVNEIKQESAQNAEVDLSAIPIQEEITSQNNPINNEFATMSVSDLVMVNTHNLSEEKQKEYEIRKAEIVGIYIASGNVGNTEVDFYNEENPINLNAVSPEGLIFKVQIAAFRKPIPQNTFGGIKPITSEKLSNSAFTRYYAGLFTDYENANTAKDQIELKGYHDAFVVAFFNGKRITNAEARAMVNNGKAYTDAKLAEAASQFKLNYYAVNNMVSAKSRDSVKSEASEPKIEKHIVYTVQIGVYGGERTAERLNAEDVFYDRTSNGYYRYFSGRHSSEHEAVQARNRIRERGVKDAFVVAFYDGKKISLGEARKLEKQINTADQPEDRSGEPSLTVSVQIVFKVQLGAYQSARQGDALTLLENMSHNGLDTYINAYGLVVYTTNAYFSYVEAQAARDRIRAKGYSDVFVVAFENGRRVPVR